MDVTHSLTSHAKVVVFVDDENEDDDDDENDDDHDDDIGVVVDDYGTMFLLTRCFCTTTIPDIGHVFFITHVCQWMGDKFVGTEKEEEGY